MARSRGPDRCRRCRGHSLNRRSPSRPLLAPNRRRRRCPAAQSRNGFCVLARLKRSPLGSMSAWRRIMYPLIGVMILVVFALSVYEAYVNVAGDDVRAFIGVPMDTGDLPPADYKGAYLRLKPGADPRFPSNLVALLETSQP